MSIPNTNETHSTMDVTPSTIAQSESTPTTTTTTTTLITTAATTATTITSTTTMTAATIKMPSQSQIPTQFRAISRNNSSASTASSSNKGDLSSTISTANSITSSRSQLSKLIDHRQLFATCGTSTPIRSFQRATISSVVKTRAFDNNPILQNLLTTPSPSGQNSISNSQTPSPHSTPIFSRSRSLRMSGGPNRYSSMAAAANAYRTRTPDLYNNSHNQSGDIPSSAHESQIILKELNHLTNERVELKENLEFLECERQVLLDTSKELKETLSNERSHYKKDIEDLKKQLTDQIGIRVKAESELTRNEMELNNCRVQIQKLNEEYGLKARDLNLLERRFESLQSENKGLIEINNELKLMLSEKLKFNGLTTIQNDSSIAQQQQRVSDCTSIVTEMARLRLELNDKDKIIANYKNGDNSNDIGNSSCSDIDNLNRFLDQTVECIKAWPEDLAGSSHVQNLMKTLLSAYRKEPDDLISNIENIHL